MRLLTSHGLQSSMRPACLLESSEEKMKEPREDKGLQRVGTKGGRVTFEHAPQKVRDAWPADAQVITTMHGPLATALPLWLAIHLDCLSDYSASSAEAQGILMH